MTRDSCARVLAGSFSLIARGGFVITIAMSTAIGSSRARIWRALTDPTELVGWDERRVSLVDPAVSYPSVGEPVRWRYQLGAVRVMLRDEPLEIEPGCRLRSSLAFGQLELEETCTLGSEPGDPERTRLGLRVVASNSVPVVGGRLDRFTVRKIVSDHTDTRLRAIQKWCENQP